MSILKSAKEMDPKTKWFYINLFLYAAVIILPIIYIYARLDYVRSYPTEKKQTYVSPEATLPPA